MTHKTLAELLQEAYNQTQSKVTQDNYEPFKDLEYDADGFSVEIFKCNEDAWDCLKPTDVITFNKSCIQFKVSELAKDIFMLYLAFRLKKREPEEQPEHLDEDQSDDLRDNGSGKHVFLVTKKEHESDKVHYVGKFTIEALAIMASGRLAEKIGQQGSMFTYDYVCELKEAMEDKLK